MGSIAGLEIQVPFKTGGNNPVTTIDPDGMLGIPWGGIIGALGSITWQTTKTVVIGNTRNLGVKGTQTTTHSLDASGALQVIGAVIAFGQGSKILNEGQEKLGRDASNAAGQQVAQQATQSTLPGNGISATSSDPGPIGLVLKNRTPWGMLLDAVKGLFGSAHVPPIAMPINEWNISLTREQVKAEQAAARNREEKKETVYGSYTIYFSNGKKYHGKGTQARVFTSALEHMVVDNTTVTGVQWIPSKNEREAFKDEYRRLQTDANGDFPEGYRNPINYNEIQSPGKNYIMQDGN